MCSPVLMYMFRPCTNTMVCKHMHLVQMKNKPKDVTHMRPQRDELDCFSTVTTSIPLSVPQLGKILKQIEKRMIDIQYLCNNSDDSSTLQKVHHHLGTVLEQFLPIAHDSPCTLLQCEIKGSSVPTSPMQHT